MAKKTQDQEGGLSVVERDVDVEKIEAELEAEGKVKKPAASTNGHRPVGRDQFLFAAKAYKPKVVIVDLPDVEGLPPGSQMKVRELRAGERDAYEQKIVKGRIGNQKIDLTELRIGLIIAAAVDWDDETTPLFQETDRPYLKMMGISVIQAIYNPASKLSAVTEEDEKELMGE